MSQERLDKALEGMTQEPVDAATLEAARVRVWNTLANPVAAGCAEVLTSEPHNPGDFNIMLMTEYKDLATMEANENKEDALAQQVVGNDEKQRQGYRERLEIREVMGGRLAREIVLEPRR
jgi:hypothetical protein